MRKIKPKVSVWEYLWYALYAFAGLGLEIVLLLVVEPILFKNFDLNNLTEMQNIIHWIFTCIVWGCVAYLIARSSNKKLNYSIINNNKFEKSRIIQALILVVIGIAINALDWGTLKVIGEAQKKTPIVFTFQYIYYLFEVVLVFEIISLGQKFFETLLNKENQLIPWGGIVLSISWGAVHFLTKGSLIEGIGTMTFGILYGLIYLALNRNTKWSYIAIALAFMI